MTLPSPQDQRQEAGMSDEMARLLPCPFCGSFDIGELRDTSRPVALVSFQCEPCGVQTAWRQGRDYAIAAWNRRVPHSVVSTLSQFPDLIEVKEEG